MQPPENGQPLQLVGGRFVNNSPIGFLACKLTCFRVRSRVYKTMRILLLLVAVLISACSTCPKSKQITIIIPETHFLVAVGHPASSDPFMVPANCSSLLSLRSDMLVRVQPFIDGNSCGPAFAISHPALHGAIDSGIETKMPKDGRAHRVNYLITLPPGSVAPEANVSVIVAVKK